MRSLFQILLIGGVGVVIVFLLIRAGPILAFIWASMVAIFYLSWYSKSLTPGWAQRNPKYSAVLSALSSLMCSVIIWFVYWHMTDLLPAGPFPMLEASPALLTYLVCLLTIAGIAVVLKTEERSKAEIVFYGIALVSALATCLVFVLLSFVLLYPSAMLPFTPPREWIDSAFMFAFLVLWVFTFAGVLSTLFSKPVPPNPSSP